MLLTAKPSEPVRAARVAPSTESVFTSPVLTKKASSFVNNASTGQTVAAAQLTEETLELIEFSEDGESDRLYVSAGQTVPVQTRMGQGEPQEKVALTLLDGGTFASGKVTEIHTLDSLSRLSFKANMGDQPGIYRVLVRQNGNETIMEFWVGEENSPKELPPSAVK